MTRQAQKDEERFYASEYVARQSYPVPAWLALFHRNQPPAASAPCGAGMCAFVPTTTGRNTTAVTELHPRRDPDAVMSWERCGRAKGY